MGLSNSLPSNLFKKLQCISCKNSKFSESSSGKKIICGSCKKEYSVHEGIPSILESGPETQEWNPWDLDEIKMLGDTFYKRAKGELPEKESSKSFANLIKSKNLYTEQSSFLDIGCATGHYLRSFRRVIDPNFQYTGIDATDYYLQRGKEVFGLDGNCNFVHCDALNLPLIDNSYDYAIVNLFHFFPNLKNALVEVMRVAEKMVIWRTPIGQVNCMAKIILNNQSYEKIGDMTLDRQDYDHCVYMLYSREYIEGIVKALGGRISFFERDNDFGLMDTKSLEDINCVPHTKIISNMQIMGNLYLDWHYIGITV